MRGGSCLSHARSRSVGKRCTHEACYSDNVQPLAYDVDTLRIAHGCLHTALKRVAFGVFARYRDRVYLTQEAKDLAQKIVGPGMIPPKYYEDALHVAVATVNGMEYLLTWNLAHIANATLRRKYEQEIRLEGYEPPMICTPEELLRSEP